MSSSTPANYVRSPDFPENYGDFRLISSDGVTFSFPRFLLAHVSPVFKDMLEIGTGNPMGQQAELRLAENFTTLDQLLRLLDPTKKPLPIHIDTIEGLLESAQKYQVERVFEYWEEQMKVIDEYGGIIKIRHPMMSFLLAMRFGRDELTTLALRELIRAPDKSLSLVNHKAITYVYGLRQERSEKLIAHIHKFQKTIRGFDCCLRPGLALTKDVTPSLILQLIKEPSWNTFEKNMDIWSSCPSPVAGHIRGSKVVFNDWKAKILEEEMVLPEIPKYF
ncbi:hypothetical protein FRC14_008068 [Serendipita sp. 396]|nr:hypothetical protein FRC14_008068 [Serendipita sp. 396]KAG8776382.1 hypothetical protein FRC15_011974 [Serendipita sp. 397]